MQILWKAKPYYIVIKSIIQYCMNHFNARSPISQPYSYQPIHDSLLANPTALKLFKRFSHSFDLLSTTSTLYKDAIPIDVALHVLSNMIYIQSLSDYSLAWTAFIHNPFTLQHALNPKVQFSLLETLSSLNSHFATVTAVENQNRRLTRHLESFKNLLLAYDLRCKVLEIKQSQGLHYVATKNEEKNHQALFLNVDGSINYSCISNAIIDLQCPISLVKFKPGDFMAILYHSENYPALANLFEKNIKHHVLTVESAQSVLSDTLKHPVTHHKVDSYITIVFDSDIPVSLHPPYNELNLSEKNNKKSLNSDLLSADTSMQSLVESINSQIYSIQNKAINLKKSLRPFQNQIEELCQFLFDRCKQKVPVDLACSFDTQELNEHLKSMTDILMFVELVNRKKFSPKGRYNLKLIHLFKHLRVLEDNSSIAIQQLDNFLLNCNFFEQENQLQLLSSHMLMIKKNHPALNDICNEICIASKRLLQEILNTEQEYCELMQALLLLQNNSKEFLLYKNLQLDCYEQIQQIQDYIHWQAQTNERTT